MKINEVKNRKTLEKIKKQRAGFFKRSLKLANL